MIHEAVLGGGFSYVSKIEYSKAAKEHRTFSFNGEYRKANKAYDKLKRIFLDIQAGTIDKNILLDLLSNGDPDIESWAAAHLLGLKHETEMAERKLMKIAKDDSLGMISFNAEMTLKTWKEKGMLVF